MALPEEIVFYSEAVSLSEVLERGLGRQAKGRPSIRDVLDALAGKLGFPSDYLGESADQVLWCLLRVLEANVEEDGPWDWIAHGESRRDLRIAERVVEAQTVDDLILAAAQFGWRRIPVRDVTTFSDIPKAVRKAFASALADRVRKLLERWTNDNVWNQDLARTRRERLAERRREETKRTLPPAS